MNFEEQIKANCGDLSQECLKILNISHLELAAIKRAVVFIFATWSGSAVASFRLLCGVLAEHTASFQLLVLDADTIDLDTFKYIFGELPQGKGEAFWIKNGQIVFRDHGYSRDMEETIKLRLNSVTSDDSNG